MKPKTMTIAQVEDNVYLRERIGSEEAAGTRLVRRRVVLLLPSRIRAAPDVAHSLRAPSALQRRPAASQHQRHGSVAAAVRTIGCARDVHRARPDAFDEAHTVSWSTDCHFLLARIEGRQMSVRAIGEIDDPTAMPADIERFDPNGDPVSGAVEIKAGSD